MHTHFHWCKWGGDEISEIFVLPLLSLLIDCGHSPDMQGEGRGGKAMHLEIYTCSSQNTGMPVGKNLPWVVRIIGGETFKPVKA